jgi:hypothetical protein
VITWQKFQPRAEFNPGQGWNFSPVSAKLKFQPWVKIIPGRKKFSGHKNFFRTEKRVEKIFRTNISLFKVQNTFSLTNSS